MSFHLSKTLLFLLWKITFFVRKILILLIIPVGLCNRELSAPVTLGKERLQDKAQATTQGRHLTGRGQGLESIQARDLEGRASE